MFRAQRPKAKGGREGGIYQSEEGGSGWRGEKRGVRARNEWRHCWQSRQERRLDLP